MKRGKQLEGFVDTLERVLVGNEDAKVVSPYMARDRTTGKSREHDVAIILKRGHHELVTAIECRDRSRPVGVPEVEGFYQKCLDTGINRSVIVSANGFYRSAVEKARYHKIECLEIDRINSFDWIAGDSMRIFQTRTENTQCTAIPDVKLASKPTNFVIRSPEGTEVTKEVLIQNLRIAVNKLTKQHPPETGSHRLRFRMLAPGFTIEDLDSGAAYPLKHIFVETTLVVESGEVPMTNLVYRREGSSDPLGRMSIASIDVPTFSADLVFSRDSDETTSMLLVPKSKSSDRRKR